MINRTEKNNIINDLAKELAARDIDVYVILTSEGSDSMTQFIPGAGTVGMGAFFFTKDNKRYSLTTSIDVQDIEETGLFNECIRYKDFSKSVHQLWEKLAPRRAAFDFSEKDPFCDGLTVGRLNKFLNAVSDLPPFETLSIEDIIPILREKARDV